MPVPKGTRIGGRQKGTPNKAGRDLRAIAQKYTPEAIELLVQTMRKGEMPFALTAANSLLDRGHGKPAPALPAPPGAQVNAVVYSWLSDDA